ncbi:MAG: hypothetical protein MMC33_009122 [Icmadophila ericetorum]|nr:hypothetical protein [Icmadophila ericetorum]
MPRPQRTKNAALKATASLPLSDAVKLISSRPTSSTTIPSDDSDGLVTSNKTGLNRRGIPKRKAEMSGALAVEDGAGSKLRRPSGKERAEISRIARDADHAIASKTRKRGENNTIAVEKGRKSLAPLPMQEADTHLLDLDTTLDSIMVGGDGTPKRRQSSSTVRGRYTPAAETSVLLGNFKRRKRQPSLLGLRVARNELSDDRIQDDELDDFRPDDESTPLNIFKTLQQAPEPFSADMSSLSTEQNYSSISRKRKLTPPIVQVLQSQLSSERSLSSPIGLLSRIAPYAEELSQGEAVTLEESTLQRESPEGELPGREFSETGTPERKTPNRETSSPQLPAPIPSSHVHTPQWNETMAPPESSSSSPASEHRSPTKPYRTKKGSDGVQSSHPPEPASRNKPSRTGNTKEPLALKPISTASLQNLLPRRRRKRRDDPFDIASSSEAEFDTSGLAHDEDELSFAAPLVRKKKINGTNVKSGKGNAKAANAKGRVDGKALFTRHDPDKENMHPLPEFDESLSSQSVYDGSIIEVLKTSKTPKLKPSHQHRPNLKLKTPLSKPVAKKTYQAKNSNGVSDSRTSNDAGLLGKEKANSAKLIYGKKAAMALAKQVKKFQNIDKWALEFEEDSRSGSSPINAR